MTAHAPEAAPGEAPSVVTVTRPHRHVALLRMRDDEHANMFTPALREETTRALKALEGDADTKVVVVCGSDKYFCCGGTQRELLDLIDGRETFDTRPFYRLLFDCALPTVAALAGHALGAGLLFGLYADIPILARGSSYSANFMSYGFTPGAGATAILPAKLGWPLATEMLLTANAFRGEELAARCPSLRFADKDTVEAEALAIARDLSVKPRQSLMLLKDGLRHELRTRLSEAIARELAMHTVSFGLPEVREAVQRRFGIS
jgi:4-carboxy-3-alkylbut-2-enoyl-[acp] decarboxylase